MEPIVNISALRAGDLAHRRGTGIVAKAILLATGIRIRGSHWWSIQSVVGWNHDAIVVELDGRLYIGDALAGPGCQLTPIPEWEAGCRSGDRILFTRPSGATAEQGKAAASWWLNNVWKKPYDKVAIWRLGLKFICGDRISGKVGLESNFYCTEGCRDSWLFGPTPLLNPWHPKLNATPGTSAKRYLERKLIDVENSLTEAGLKYRVEI